MQAQKNMPGNYCPGMLILKSGAYAAPTSSTKGGKMSFTSISKAAASAYFVMDLGSTSLHSILLMVESDMLAPVFSFTLQAKSSCVKNLLARSSASLLVGTGFWFLRLYAIVVSYLHIVIYLTTTMIIYSAKKSNGFTTQHLIIDSKILLLCMDQYGTLLKNDVLLVTSGHKRTVAPIATRNNRP